MKSNTLSFDGAICRFILNNVLFHIIYKTLGTINRFTTEGKILI